MKRFGIRKGLIAAGSAAVLGLGLQPAATAQTAAPGKPQGIEAGVGAPAGAGSTTIQTIQNTTINRNDQRIQTGGGDYVGGDKVMGDKVEQHIRIAPSDSGPAGPSAVREHCFTFDGQRFCERY